MPVVGLPFSSEKNAFSSEKNEIEQTKIKKPSPRPRSQKCSYRSTMPVDSVSCKTCGKNSIARDLFFCSHEETPDTVLTHPYRTDYVSCSKCEFYTLDGIE